MNWIDLPGTKSRVAASPVTNRMWQKFLEESGGYTPNADEHDGDYLKHWVGGKPPEDRLDHPVAYVSYIQAWAYCDFYGWRLPTEKEIATLDNHGIWEWYGDRPSVSCRGGNFNYFVQYVRCADRNYNSPTFCNYDIGFRPAQDIVPSGREWTVTLPFPPTLNTMWRRAGQCTYLSEKGRQFRANAVSVIRDVSTMCDAKIESRLEVRITLHAPTRRSYDVDNFAKAVLDALTHAGFWADDSQVDRLTLERGDVRKGGCAVIQIREVEP